MADAVYTFFAILATLIGGSGVILNFLVCLMYFATPKLLDATNIFMLNMAVGDFTYSIVALPLLVASNARGEWAFGEAGCTAYAFITFFFALGIWKLKERKKMISQLQYSMISNDKGNCNSM